MIENNIKNLEEIKNYVQPKNDRNFWRWLNCKVGEFAKHPQLLPYEYSFVNSEQKSIKLTAARLGDDLEVFIDEIRVLV